eukprot:CAMPEP_0113247828 /NCGR_PEP_ID=MMETSP0008_2-20120614/10196_1 /TAXON_ID=97485 /ORGANISM="Prymnesium parvum" /LENGTH=148 /DNA_ID=CAMNT_0000095645 /DNA_START=297 /DNA_END=739 /DNA_ORIENTATION=+ /assembly_acc=CAM_ASM_000153
MVGEEVVRKAAAREAEVREAEVSAHGEAAQKAATESLSKSARPLLRDTCDKFKDPDSFDRVLSCTKEVDEVRGILHGTVGQLLSNQDNLEVLEDKAEDLRTSGDNERGSVEGGGGEGGRGGGGEGQAEPLAARSHRRPFKALSRTPAR